MTHEEIEALAHRVETASPRDPELVRALLLALAAVFPEDVGADAPDPRALGSTEYALGLLRRKLPGWHLHLDGHVREPGDWTCTLRRSTTRDDDDLIGIGKGPTAALAIVAALLRVALRRARGYR